MPNLDFYEKLLTELYRRAAYEGIKFLRMPHAESFFDGYEEHPDAEIATLDFMIKGDLSAHSIGLDMRTGEILEAVANV